MINAVIYSKQTGVIIQRIQGDLAGVLAVIETGQDIVGYDGCDTNQFYIDVTTKTYTPYPPRPTEDAQWDGHQWVDNLGAPL